MQVVTDPQCRHPGCGCVPEPPFEGFCSLYCRNVVQDAARAATQTDPEGACACGHEACTALEPDDRIAPAPGA
jgi:hypothetical protein